MLIERSIKIFWVENWFCSEGEAVCYISVAEYVFACCRSAVMQWSIQKELEILTKQVGYGKSQEMDYCGWAIFALEGADKIDHWSTETHWSCWVYAGVQLLQQMRKDGRQHEKTEQNDGTQQWLQIAETSCTVCKYYAHPAIFAYRDPCRFRTIHGSKQVAKKSPLMPMVKYSPCTKENTS